MILKRVFQDFFEKATINVNLDETYICLIAKKIDAKRVGYNRPISLTTCLYKIMARVLSERLKQVLPNTVTDNQFAFVVGCQIIDASLIVNELIDLYTRNKTKGMVIELDIEKAFDMVDWEFLDNITVVKGSGNKWRRWIMGCISSTNFSIIINGHPRGKIKATRGLRQGNPLPPFLFTLMVDYLSIMLTKGLDAGHVEGFNVRNSGLSINHLQFADDTILFSSDEKNKLTNFFSFYNY